MSLRLLTERIKALALQDGAHLVGIAPIERFKNAPKMASPQGILPTANSVVVIALHHPDASIELGSPEHPQVPGSGGWGTGDMVGKLNFIAFRVARLLERFGYAAIPIANTTHWRFRPYKELTCFMADISHRHAAVAAGLGELGWHSLLITPEYGPRVRLSTVITDAMLEPNPMYEGPPLCDRCMECAKNCPAKAFEKEVSGINEVEIGGKVFKYPNKNLWRCAWGEHFGLDLSRPVPDEVTEEVVLDALARYGRRGGEQGQCLKFCLPPHLRYSDPSYCRPYRRKRQFSLANSSQPMRVVTDNVKAIAVQKGVDLVGIASLEKTKQLGLNLKDYLPDAESAIVIGVRNFQFERISENIWSYPIRVIHTRLSFVGLDIAKYLEELGFSVLLADLPTKIAVVAADMGTLDNKGAVITTEYGSNISFQSVITSAPLVSSPPANKITLKRRQGSQMIRSENLTISIKTLAKTKGVDMVGIAPVERLEQVKETLTEMVKDEGYFTCRDKQTLHGQAKPEVHCETLNVRSPSDYLQGANSVIVLGMHFPHSSVDRAAKPPAETVGPYAFAYYESQNQLYHIALDVIRCLDDLGYEAVPAADLCGLGSKKAIPFGRRTREDLTCNRYAAIAAGLGELGWSGLVLTPDYGPRQTFLSIITNATLDPSPLYKGPPLCRRCLKCVESCPVKAISDSGKLKLTIDEKVFEYGRCDRLRCDWAKRYALVGEEGPKYTGSKTDILPPDEITPMALCEALKKIDPIQKVYETILERCMAVCPTGNQKF